MAIVALDQGTTSSRTVIFDAHGIPISQQNRTYTQIFPQPGWVEHDPSEILMSQLSTLRQALASAQMRAQDVSVLGITNQRETVIVWDRETGRPIYNAIVWQCRRTAGRYEAAARGWPGADDRGKDRIAAGCLFFRQQAAMDLGSCAGRAADGQGRPPVMRHGGYLAFMEFDRRQNARHRPYQRLEDHAVQPAYPCLGPGAAGIYSESRRKCCPRSSLPAPPTA